MGKCRDCFGKLSYTAVNKRKSVFSVTRGDNRIIKHVPYMRTDAYLSLSDKEFFVVDIPHFDSFIHAVRFMKANIDSLV